MPKLAAFWESVRTSLWFVPGLMVLGSIVVAWLAVQVEVTLDRSAPIWWFNQGSVSEASELLSSLLGSMITMTTLVISITMVVLTLAAAQLGPRLIRHFVGDWRTQIVLGLFLGTIIYLLLVFRLLDSDLADDAVPHFAVTAGTAHVFVCLLALLYYVHHLSQSIVADTVVERVGRDLDRQIRHQLPGPDAVVSLFKNTRPEIPARFGLPASGYVQAIDFEALVEAATERRALIELDIRPGHHILKGRDHVRVWPPSALDKDLSEAVTDAILIGPQRTATQDIEFAARQLVEIALRALSPSVNDPFTAIAVIDRLASSIALLMEHGEAPRIWHDTEGGVRLVAATSTFAGLVGLAFNQIRQAAGDHPDVLIRMIDALTRLAAKPGNAEQARVLAEHLDRIVETAREATEVASDLAAVEERYGQALMDRA